MDNLKTEASENKTEDGKYCIDRHEKVILHGYYYVPKTDACTVCVCDGPDPKWCRSVLCSPPPSQNCRSFRAGKSCCDLVCLDDIIVRTGGPLRPPPSNVSFSASTQLLPKVVAVSVTVLLSISLLFFLIYRLRKRKLQSRITSHAQRQRSRRCEECDEAPGLDFPMDLFDSPQFHGDFARPPQYLSWWKPSCSYLPSRDEAPPPYEEAITGSISSAYLRGCGQPDVGHAVIQDTSFADLPRVRPSSSATNHSLVIPRRTPLVSRDSETNPATINCIVPPNPVSIQLSQHHFNDVTDAAPSIEHLEPVPGPSHSIRTHRNLLRCIPLSISRTPSVHQSGDKRFPSNGEILFKNIDPFDPKLPRSPPTYEESISQVNRQIYRHSLTLPSGLELPLARQAKYSIQARNQRLSLQFDLGDWSSSSSTLSISSAQTPTQLRRNMLRDSSSSSCSTNP